MMHLGTGAVLAALLGMGISSGVLAGPVVSGLVSVTPEGRASFYFTEALPDNQAVSIQTRSAKGTRQGARTSCCTRIARSELKAMASAPEQVTNGSDSPVAAYVLDHALAGDWGETGFVGIAMSAPKVVSKGSYAVLGHSGDAVTRARLCFGTEGLNLISAARGKVHSLYLAFGYEIDESPKCTASDERDLGRVGE